MRDRKRFETSHLRVLASLMMNAKTNASKSAAFVKQMFAKSQLFEINAHGQFL